MPSKKSVPYEQHLRLARYRARHQRPPSSRDIKQTISKRSVRSKRNIDKKYKLSRKKRSTNTDLTEHYVGNKDTYVVGKFN